MVLFLHDSTPATVDSGQHPEPQYIFPLVGLENLWPVLTSEIWCPHRYLVLCANSCSVLVSVLSLSGPICPSPRRFELFSEIELMVNPTKHELVPKHIPLSNEDKRSLLRNHKLRETDLPRIQATDPVACYFGMAKGQVFKIIRHSETSGEYFNYRLVV